MRPKPIRTLANVSGRGWILGAGLFFLTSVLEPLQTVQAESYPDSAPSSPAEQHIFSHRFTGGILPAGGGGGTGPSIEGCPIFPANNIWNARIDTLPVHARSGQWIDSIGRDTGLHMDFGSGTWAGGPIGIPYNIADAATPVYTVLFGYAGESDPGPYPIPADPLIEYGSDHHLLVMDHSSCTLHEIFDAEYSGGEWYGGSGAIWNLGSNALRPAGWTSADAAGLPILPGLVRYDEILAGEINHAIRFTADQTNGYIWPARHLTSDDPGAPHIPPMGARFRLNASYDISGFPAELRVILTAMKRYGIILADNGSSWFVTGAPDERWDNDMLHELDVLTGDDFEAVDASGLMVDPDSGEVIVEEPPGAFAKSGPDSGAFTATSPTLFWGASSGADFYIYCVDATDNGLCDTSWVNTGSSTSADLSGLGNNDTYYWFVAATNGGGTTYADGGTWWSFTARDQTFADVPIDHSFWAEIEAFYNAGITTGCGVSPLRFCPDNTVTRAAMAVFLLRAKYGSGYAPPAATHTFSDLPVVGKEWQEAWVDQFYYEGITSGCGFDPLIYCPENPVTRAAMAVFILRTMYGSSYTPPAAGHYFADLPVAGKEWMEPWVDQLYREGITSGCGTGPLIYCPENAVKRQGMAAFIVRAFNLPLP